MCAASDPTTRGAATDVDTLRQMRIGHIELPVEDPGRSARFYVDVLGFEVVAENPDIMWVGLGELQLQLRRGTPRATVNDLDDMNLVLYSDAPEVELATLIDSGVTISERANCHHFQDPDGYWWQLVDPAADHRAD